MAKSGKVARGPALAFIHAFSKTYSFVLDNVRFADMHKKLCLNNAFVDEDDVSIGAEFDKLIRNLLNYILAHFPNTPTQSSLYRKLIKLFPTHKNFFLTYWMFSPPPKATSGKVNTFLVFHCNVDIIRKLNYIFDITDVSTVVRTEHLAGV
jgi:hypothetical protein